MSREVELRMAYTWTCEECGRDNFVNGLTIERDDAALQEMQLEHGVEPWEQGQWMEAPGLVTCAHCRATFATRHYSEPYDETT